MKTLECEDPIDEAKRHIRNAKDVLKNDAHKEDKIYLDDKYVKAAGHYGWTACLLALDAAYNVKTSKKKGRVSIDDYKNVIAKRDPKFWAIVHDAYEVLHLYMTYDGNRSVSVCKGGIEMATEIINHCQAKRSA